MDTREKLRARFRQAREAAGKSQGDVARHFGVERGTVWRWEAGQTPFSLETLLAAAELLGCSPAWLVLGEGNAPQALPSTSPPSELDDEDADEDAREGAA
jgi:transcriptional regulator with XRE-family HTH domain